MLAYEYCFETALKAEEILAELAHAYAGDGQITLHTAPGCEECEQQATRAGWVFTNC